MAAPDFEVTLDERVFLEPKDDGGTFEATCDPQAPLEFAFNPALALLASQGQSLDKHRLKTTNMFGLGVVSVTELVDTIVSLGLDSGATTVGPE